MLKVLILDDDRISLKLAERIVATTGCEAIPVDNSKRAKILLSQDKYDIIITDIVMPGEDGFDFIQFIHDKHLDSKIIAVSAGYEGMGADMMLRSAESIGVDFVVEKPFDSTFKDTIKDCVHQLIRHRRAQATQ